MQKNRHSKDSIVQLMQQMSLSQEKFLDKG